MTEVKVARMNAKVAYNVEIGRHHVATDVTPEEGGQDLGPSPHDLLSASLAACTALTLQMYANHKGWPLTSADVAVSHEERDGAFVFKIRLHFNGSLDEAQRARLTQVARQCPVHKTLSGPIKIETVGV